MQIFVRCIHSLLLSFVVSLFRNIFCLQPVVVVVFVVVRKYVLSSFQTLVHMAWRRPLGKDFLRAIRSLFFPYSIQLIVK